MPAEGGKRVAFHSESSPSIFERPLSKEEDLLQKQFKKPDYSL